MTEHYAKRDMTYDITHDKEDAKKQTCNSCSTFAWLNIYINDASHSATQH